MESMIVLKASGSEILLNGDGMKLYRHVAPRTQHLLIFDPPWDRMLEFECNSSDNILAFCDGRRAGDVVRLFGPPAWVFTWDCVSCWYTPNRPLQRAKYAFWYGDIEWFNPDAQRIPGAERRPRLVSNARSTYLFVPKPGRALADVYSEPITKLHQSGHNHGKPIDWMAALIGCCARPGDIVLDPFAGGGASLQAARINSMSWVGCEIEMDRAIEIASLPHPIRNQSATGDLFAEEPPYDRRG